MNTMKMPGFAAECSLYKGSKHYYLAGTLSALKGGQKVVPQRIRFWERVACGIGTAGATLVGGPAAGAAYSALCLALADESD